ncbi:MAG: GNAT family N-acetyltransferase [Clostridia bacterium]|nr:GNAT family N-acetyltransferase [Clostridia bacterium]
MIIDEPGRADIPSLRRLWREAFGDTEAFLDSFWRTAFSPSRCRCVTLDGEAVAALYWFDCEHMGRRIAYLYAIATAKSRRGQGLCRRLMENTHRHLQDLGYEGAVLVPGDRGLFGLYGKMGYTICGHIRKISCDASESETGIRPIEPAEYEMLRRRFLPHGGVIQEKENTVFLQSMSKLYAGEGFLLAARREGDTLYGTELLGEENAAPAIVRALGCTKGIFRTVGTEIPFAMYLPFPDSRLDPPTYFGLAFD